MRKLTILATAIVVAVAFVGCTQRIGDFTLISTKNVEIGGKYKKLEGRAEGTDSRAMIFTIPLGTPDLKQAVDNCIENGKGDLLTNAVVDYTFWTAIVYGQIKYAVKADVWGKADMGDLYNPSIELYELHSSENGLQLVSMVNPAASVKVDYLTSR